MIAELMAPMETPDTPIGLDLGFMQRLVDASLVGPERTAALQHQRHALAAVRPPAWSLKIAQIACRRVHGNSAPNEVSVVGRT